MGVLQDYEERDDDSSSNEQNSMYNVQENAAAESPRLLERVRNKVRLKHYSIRTEEALLGLSSFFSFIEVVRVNGLILTTWGPERSKLF
jgi:hypothetical protein